MVWQPIRDILDSWNSMLSASWVQDGGICMYTSTLPREVFLGRGGEYIKSSSSLHLGSFNNQISELLDEWPWVRSMRCGIGPKIR